MEVLPEYFWYSMAGVTRSQYPSPASSESTRAPCVVDADSRVVILAACEVMSAPCEVEADSRELRRVLYASNVAFVTSRGEASPASKVMVDPVPWRSI